VVPERIHPVFKRTPTVGTNVVLDLFLGDIHNHNVALKQQFVKNNSDRVLAWGSVVGLDSGF
jgi:hypothetical protein